MENPSYQTFFLISTYLLLSITFLGNHAIALGPAIVYSDEDAISVPESSPLSFSSSGTIAEPPSQGTTSESPSGDGWNDAPTTTDKGTSPFSSVPVVKDTPAVNMFVQSAMVKSMSKTEDFIHDVLEKRLNDPDTDEQRKECLKTCKDVYQDSMNAMKKTVKDTKDGNLYKANVDVSAMSTDVDTCKECMGRVYSKDDPEFKKFTTWIDGVTNDCLDKITGLGN
ncbi:unnamed protein product [Cuscuta epithymum]|uniref:Pectinesterase inhibitor domain-containing protein n=1 Tax=Cuscuta epithymum TaxID=186058 RepID=A0AAV0CC73_9ASTE|nr:unnamed protein product [Cuscuta epithymum]